MTLCRSGAEVTRAIVKVVLVIGRPSHRVVWLSALRQVLYCGLGASADHLTDEVAISREESLLQADSGHHPPTG